MGEQLSDVSAFLGGGGGGEYLKARDVEAGPRTFTVKRAEVEHFEAKGDRKAERKVVLTLDGDPMCKLPLNKGNLQTLTDAWGTDARRWIGQVFDAYLDASVRDPSGRRSGGLRVRVRELAAAPGGNGALPEAALPHSEPPF